MVRSLWKLPKIYVYVYIYICDITHIYIYIHTYLDIIDIDMYIVKHGQTWSDLEVSQNLQIALKKIIHSWMTVFMSIERHIDTYAGLGFSPGHLGSINQ